MKRKNKLKVFLYIDIAILLILIFYKGYLFVFERDFNSVNINSITKIQDDSEDKNEISFVVLGNIKNSIDVFDNKIIKMINNDEDIDFVISLGDAVLDGEEDKYRILNKSINKINVPTIIGIGEKEVSEGGAIRYYKHFGPLYFSFAVNDAYYVFLDTTGKTSYTWQKHWLEKELENSSGYKHRFIFLNKPPFIIESKSSIDLNKEYIKDKEFRDYLRGIFSKFNVDAVFCSGLEIFDERKIDGIPYYITGCAGGGLMINDSNSFYHYLKVDINEDGVEYNVIKDDTPLNSAIFRAIENIWIYIHSIFYINLLNLFFIIVLLTIIGVLIYLKASIEVDYYQDFDRENDIFTKKEKLNIAMFTNNYLPFIGGVPLSINRLTKGLKKNGHNVSIFAPEYPEANDDKDSDVIRCKLLLYYKAKVFFFPIINIFSSKIEKEFIKGNYDVIHVHHPFWMGKKGLKLGEKYNLPVVLTYHTRLEMYAHYIPFLQMIFKNIISHRIIKRFSQKCKAVFAPTNTAKEYLSNIGVSRHTAVLPTGIDFENYTCVDEEIISDIRRIYVKDNELLLCSVSRLAKEKNIFFLLEGIKSIKENSDIPFKCIIIGDGPEKENLLKVVEDYGLEDTIVLVGSVSPDNISKYYMAADIFVYSSKSETQGMVLLEAMAGKCPVVAISSSGINDVIKNDYNGYKTKPNIELWCAKVISLMSNDERLKTMSNNAYDFAMRFSLEAMADRATRMYYRVIQENYTYRAKNNIEITEEE
ncbi:MAG: glycosyltransferase [Eubacteriaceae bacterium]